MKRHFTIIAAMLAAMFLITITTASFAADTTTMTATNVAKASPYMAGGTLYIPDYIVKAITAYKVGQDVYLACGEIEGKDGPVGNAWLQDTSLQASWTEYRLTPPGDGNNWTVKVPAAFYAKGYIRFNVAQVDAKETRWSQIHLYRGAPWYYCDGLAKNAIVVPLR